jgi:GNAT superfamily N-acetyltransferase
MSSAYDLVPIAPAEADYLRLRAEAGLTPKTADQARSALPGSWAACHVLHIPTGEPVAMGRVIGDGGWYFHVVDMAVLPSHQRRGLGAIVLHHLLQRIEESAPPAAYVSLLADPPGQRLYEAHGFRTTTPNSVGMALVTERGAGT